ncbi:uncharacterized protein BXZ73DRAFT_92280 [Epithele typhae]|uniref:uncharacterized protein n=1 Tax=Epithele typhae TaxID=378194 RepID=UPI0020079292|nr:uncharacterized protein BXZ73DRAFT_92280 [Epithele typhae]KAH9918227.1 hypothetical protein BXZ73DRAFT_92280 [Epithele typhae]
MSSSELSNALNPHVVVQRTKRRQISAPSQTSPPISPALSTLPRPSAPHRSELELAFAQSSIPVVQSPVVQQASPPRHAVPVTQDMFRAVNAARNAFVAERSRRVGWENDQESKRMQLKVELDKQIADMRQELTMMKTYLSLHPNFTMPAELRNMLPAETVPSTAHIEAYASPSPSFAPTPVSPVSPLPYHPLAPQPMFMQGSSSRPLAVPGAHVQQLPPNTPPNAVPERFSEINSLPTPPSSILPRHVIEDNSDYDSDSEDSDASTVDQRRKRKNGHDIHAVRIHIRKLMKLQHGEALPPSAFEGLSVDPDAPVRFVWDKTSKQSAINGAMKQRIVADLKAHRHKYRHVPDKEFVKKNVEAAFEQVFTTLRQKYRAQVDETAAAKLKKREDTKALKVRRALRKKTKLGNRTDARTRLPAFAQPVFDSALQAECMSSEESDGAAPHPTDPSAEPVPAFRTRGPPWRSSRLRRFYGILDDQDRVEKAAKPKRGAGRRVRRDGPPKDGLVLPPKSVVRWMVSKRWIREVEASRPEMLAIIEGHIVERTEPESELVYFMLGPDDSDTEMDQATAAPAIYGHVSETSYSLYNALQPI